MKTSDPNHFGKKLLVESCQKITIKNFFAHWKKKFKEQIFSSKIILEKFSISLESTETYWGGKRYWFLCPSCEKRKAILFKHPLTRAIGCRICLNLDYKKRIKKDMIEEICTKGIVSS